VSEVSMVLTFGQRDTRNDWEGLRSPWGAGNVQCPDLVDVVWIYSLYEHSLNYTHEFHALYEKCLLKMKRSTPPKKVQPDFYHILFSFFSKSDL
jgi:hypothetical protein